MGNITLYLKTDRITNTRTDIVVERETGEIVRKVSAGNSMSNSWQLLSGKPRKTSAQHLFRSSLSLSLSLSLSPSLWNTQLDCPSIWSMPLCVCEFPLLLIYVCPEMALWMMMTTMMVMVTYSKFCQDHDEICSSWHSVLFRSNKFRLRFEVNFLAGPARLQEA